MEESKLAEDLNHIREVMNRSSRSVSLTGLSPITAGIIGTAGAYVAYSQFFQVQEAVGLEPMVLSAQSYQLLHQIIWPTLILGLGLGVLFAWKEISRRRDRISKQHIRQLFINLGIPLLSGGLVCLFLFLNGFLGISIGLTLLFYGLALIHADKYTLGDIKTLGMLEMALGMCALYFTNYGIICWGIGFGLLNIIYGIIMQVKRDS